MKHISRTVIAVLLAVLVMAIMPAQVFADSITEYISEVKVYIGSYKDAEKEGFTILNGDNGKPVDLNQDAGGGLGSKGDKAVYLGYKTTKDSKDAITDLALMNMKGGYSTADYDALMELQIKSQIIPFVENFLATINEYRENYNSDIEANQMRAQYVHDMLNKLTDDDCGGKGLGDLFLNETKYELGDKAYDALSDEQKKEHADIVTIVAQSNGQATLLINNLLTRASDTNEDTWIDRFSELTYDDLADETGMSPSEAYRELAMLYDDDASDLLYIWDDFREELEGYENSLQNVADSEGFDYEAFEEKYDNFDMETATSDEVLEALTDMTEERSETTQAVEDLGIIAVHEYLDSIEYGDGTLLDFFMQSEEDVADDITMLYPMIASLTDGQRAGMEYVSLKELILMTLTDEQGFDDEDINNIETASIYDGVDRGIYQKGGVALTSDALRKDALEKSAEGTAPLLSTLTKVMIGISAASIVASITSIVARNMYFAKAAASMTQIQTAISTLKTSIATNQQTLTQLGNTINNSHYFAGGAAGIVETTPNGIKYINTMADVPDDVAKAMTEFMSTRSAIEQSEKTIQKLESTYQNVASSKVTVNRLMVGVTVAMVIISAVTTYLTWRDMQAHYKVDFTPIPLYMVDEKDIVSYNAKGEKIVIKNQSAYYKAVESNLKIGDFKFNEIGNIADMNGCVGKQWLALYVNRNNAMEPIIASSLKAVVGSSTIPAGYSGGIHFFGSKAAFNLNSNLYDWNESAKSIFVYYKTDSSATSATGSNFTGGTLALAGGAGLAVGAIITALAMKPRKKKETKAEA